MPKSKKAESNQLEPLKRYYCQDCHKEYPMVWECLGCGKYKCRDCIAMCTDLRNFIETMTEIGIKEFDLLAPYGSKRTSKMTKQQVEDGVFS